MWTTPRPVVAISVLAAQNTRFAPVGPGVWKTPIDISQAHIGLELVFLSKFHIWEAKGQTDFGMASQLYWTEVGLSSSGVELARNFSRLSSRCLCIEQVLSITGATGTVKAIVFVKDIASRLSPPASTLNLWYRVSGHTVATSD